MKRFFYIFLATLFMTGMTSSVFAGEYGTIFGGQNAEYSGWGGFEMKGGPVFDDEFGLFLGGKGGLLINQSFTIGLAGYGLVPFHRVRIYEDPADNPKAYMGYGGLYLEYTVAPRSPINASFSCLLGGGGIGYSYDFISDYDGTYKDYVTDPILVAEPGISVGLNVTKWLKVEIGGSYKFITAIDEDGDFLEAEDFRGFTGNVGFKFGWFGSSKDFNKVNR